MTKFIFLLLLLIQFFAFLHSVLFFSGCKSVLSFFLKVQSFEEVSFLLLCSSLYFFFFFNISLVLDIGLISFFTDSSLCFFWFYSFSSNVCINSYLSSAYTRIGIFVSIQLLIMSTLIDVHFARYFFKVSIHFSFDYIFCVEYDVSLFLKKQNC